MATCRKCGGSGKIGWFWRKRECDWCEGKGQTLGLNQISKIHDHVPGKKERAAHMPPRGGLQDP